MKHGWMTLAAFGMGCAVLAMAQAPPADQFTGRPRVAILSDIGNEPDDQMSLVRLLVYSNQLDIEALVATTSVWQRAAVHPETMRTLVEAYGKVRANLLLHAAGWPEAGDLLARVYSGQTGYGLAGTGAGKTSEGAKAVIQAADRDDPRPLWVCLWGGANTLAQALIEVRATRSAADLQRFVSRLRVYSISDQDDAGAWLRREFPQLYYIAIPSTQGSDEYYYATWTGISGDVYYRNCGGADPRTVTNEWLETNIRAKGPLGKVYPKFAFIMEGDTPSFLGLLDNGLNSFRRPDWGGWGGRYVWRTPRGESHAMWTQGGDMFSRISSQDTVRGADGREVTSDQATIWRWREAYQHDFAARMDWTVEDFAHANHNPAVSVNGDKSTAPVVIDVEVGKPVTLDAGATRDPDGQRLHFHWFHYMEAGTTGSSAAAIEIAGGETARAVATVTSACRPAWLPGRPCPATGVGHVILEVTDEGTPRLTSYRRVILNVRAPAR
ncbi:MAG: DUF1593 domain-containing protein [Candidatus Solibacter sp.]